jgi:hypothetical protein
MEPREKRVKQPWHIILRQYRIMAIVLTAFFCILLWDMWSWFQVNFRELTDWANTAFIAMVVPIIATVKWSLENVIKKHEKDDHDHDS